MMESPVTPGPGPDLERGGDRGALLGLAGLALIFVLLLMPVKKIPDEGWLAGAWNLQHLPGFFLLTRCLQLIFRRFLPPRLTPLLAAAFALFAAIGSELIQGQIGRSASLVDVVLDTFGIALATIWPCRPASFTPLRIGLWIAVLLGGIVFAFVPALRLEWHRAQARDRLPVLWDARLTARFWKTQGPARAEVDPATGVMRVRISPGEYGGVNFTPGLQDWSPYDELVLRLSNPGPPLRLGVRIDDRRSLRERIWFSSAAEVRTGDSEVRIPLSRRGSGGTGRGIDYSQVARLLLFVDKTDFAVEFSVHSADLAGSAGSLRL